MPQPGFYFLLCPDARLLRDQIDELIGQWQMADAEFHTFWADDSLDHFWNQLTLPDLVARKKILFLRQAHTLNAETWKKLSQTLGTPHDALPIFCMECAWEKGQPRLLAHIAKLRCLTFAEKQGWIWKSAGLEQRRMPAYIQAQAKAMGITLNPQAVELLAAALPLEAAAVHNAMEQLNLLAKDGPVTAEVVRQLAKHNPEVILFDFIRQVQNGQVNMVWAHLVREQADELLFPFLGVLARELRILWQCRAGEEVHLPPQVLDSKRQIAQRLGWPGLAAMFEAAVEAELSVKSGARSPAQAMEFLVAGLTLAFAPQSGRSRLGSNA